ncbi:MAG: phenylalanine--tRNA ligase subunit beta [Eubacteriales bacterium]|nr:phenylalanine--tRNA ligase subunit beta [Eubacteriales bacterium]
MRVPLSWLNEYLNNNSNGVEAAGINAEKSGINAENSGIILDAEAVAREMTMTGTKAEGIEYRGSEIKNIVTGLITKLYKHPEADRLLVSKVDTGEAAGVIQVITGADNISEGDTIAVALAGSTISGGKKIGKGKLRGLESNGMMCSPDELGLTPEDCPGAVEDGILILDPGIPSGIDAAEVLSLRETVIDFEITPNRPDCLSMTGIAREAAATLDLQFVPPQISVVEQGAAAASLAVVEVKAPDLCPRYTARVITDVKIAPSPVWMRRRLRAAGVRPINNIVDITNYVMLELGQPLHSFDLAGIAGRRIIVRRAADNEKILTLDEQERLLDSSMLVIADAEGPVAVAGVMGGEGSGISPGTKSILLESAYFDKTSVRLAAKKLGMRSEASSRFEKGLDPENTIIALNRAAQLIEMTGAGKVCSGVIDSRPEPQERRTAGFRPEKINSLLGTAIPVSTMISILEKLGFKTGVCGGCSENDMIQVEVPSFRGDIVQEADIAEEVARFYGYNNIEATLSAGSTLTQGGITRSRKTAAIMSCTMNACGLSEVCTYSFTSPKVLDMMRVPAGSPLRDAVKIQNPLGEDFSIMRTSAIPEMLGVIALNNSRRIAGGGFFEIAGTYVAQEQSRTGQNPTEQSLTGKSSAAEKYKYMNEKLGDIPVEKRALVIGLYGVLGASDTQGSKISVINPGKKADFLLLKGIIEELIDVLKIKPVDFEPLCNDPLYHPGRAAKIIISGICAGTFGEVHPDVSQAFGTPERTYVASLDADMLIGCAAGDDKNYEPLPRYPAVRRDIAVLVGEDIQAKKLEETIRQKAGKLLTEAVLFDVYKGDQTPVGMKSVAYSLSFRAQDRTLTDNEADSLMAGIAEGLEKAFGASVRGT